DESGVSHHGEHVADVFCMSGETEMTINNQVSDADTHGATTGAPVDRHVIPQGLASRNSPGVCLSGRS
ncbi:hypothetical protein, partial [Mycobacterium tuberculosis]